MADDKRPTHTSEPAPKHDVPPSALEEAGENPTPTQQKAALAAGEERPRPGGVPAQTDEDAL